MSATTTVSHTEEENKMSKQLLRLKPLSLIVATTPSLGIGKSGQLPWPPLRTDLGHFARVTKAPPRHAPAGTRNAVIMGRKTWDSIPAALRPLKGRINVVVSRSAQAGVQTLPRGHNEVNQASSEEGSVLMASSLEDAVHLLSRSSPATDSNNIDTAKTIMSAQQSHQHQHEHEARRLGHIFIIGGASIYKSCLESPTLSRRLKRIYLTKIHTEFDCDTYFPFDVSAASSSSSSSTSGMAATGTSASAFDATGTGVGADAGTVSTRSTSAVGAEWKGIPLEWDLIGPKSSKDKSSGTADADGAGTLEGKQSENGIDFEFLLYERQTPLSPPGQHQGGEKKKEQEQEPEQAESYLGIDLLDAALDWRWDWDFDFDAAL